MFNKEAGFSLNYADFNRFINQSNLKKIQTTLDKEEQVLKDIIFTETKRHDILVKMDNEALSKVQKKELRRLRKHLEKNRIKKGIVTYLKNANKELRGTVDATNNALQKHPNVNITGRLLRTLKNFIESYEVNIIGIEQLLYEEKMDGNNELLEYMEDLDVLKNVKSAISEARSAYQHYALPATVDFLAPYVPESLANRYKMTKEEFAHKIAAYSDKDITNLNV